MAICEICGTEEDTLTTIRIDGAKLEACSNCNTMGEVVGDVEPSSEDEENTENYTEPDDDYQSQSYTSQQYQMASEAEHANAPSSFEDDVEELVYNYDERIRKSREQMGKSREEVAANINEKTSLIERLERGKSLPSEKVRRKLENELDIELTSKGGI
jgi:putative transcription factor